MEESQEQTVLAKGAVPCPKCGYTNSHSSEEALTCPECGVSFTRQDAEAKESHVKRSTWKAWHAGWAISIGAIGAYIATANQQLFALTTVGNTVVLVYILVSSIFVLGSLFVRGGGSSVLYAVSVMMGTLILGPALGLGIVMAIELCRSLLHGW